jgi:Fe-S-cluster containining protein
VKEDQGVDINMKREWTSPTSYLRHFLRRLQGKDLTVNVPCNGCNECCKLGGDLTLDDGTVFKPTKEGHCPKLINEKCSIYDERPLQCRIYDCRIYALLGLGDKDHPEFTKVIESWEPKLNTKEDEDLLGAFRIATIIVRDKYPDLEIDKAGAKILKFFLQEKQELMRQAVQVRKTKHENINSVP